MKCTPISSLDPARMYGSKRVATSPRHVIEKLILLASSSQHPLQLLNPLAGSPARSLAVPPGSSQCRLQVGVVEIVAHKQQRHLQSLRQGIGETVAEVQAAGMAPLAITARQSRSSTASATGSRRSTASTALVSTARSITRLPSAAETVIAVAQDLFGAAVIQHGQRPNLLLQPEPTLLQCGSLRLGFTR